MRRRDWLLGTLASTVPVCARPAQTGGAPPEASPAGRLLNAKARREAFHANLTMRAEALTRGQFAGISSRTQWEAVRADRLQKLRGDLGIPGDDSKSPLHAQVTSTLNRDGYSVENVVFQSSPGLYVIGNLYVPARRDGEKLPTVVYVCGHSPSPIGAKANYQHHGIWFARNGFVAFVLDTIEFGEIPGIHHGTHDLEMWHWLSLGYNPGGVETWNAIRALDYLETRPEVDRSRVAVTGRSGGGAVSWFTAAVDDRFHVASPVHGTWSIGPHIRDNVVRENCDCIYTWNSGLLDLPSIGALIAPRPLMIVNALRDDSFPPAGYQVVESQLRDVYKWYGAEEKLATFEDNTGHQDTPAYRKAANLWIARWLTGEEPVFTEQGIQPEADPSVLRVLPGIPPDSRNEGIDRTFIPTKTPSRYSTLAAWKNRREDLGSILRDKLLQGLAPKSTPFSARRVPLHNWTDRYTQASNLQFNTEEGLTVSGQLFVPADRKAIRSALIYVKGHDDLVYGIDYDDILSLLAEHVVLVLRPRAVDYGMDNAEMAETKMAAALLGTTLETLQLHDVLRSIDFLTETEELQGKAIAVYGRKSMAMVALYAAAFDDRVARVILDRPPSSHWDGPAVLHALRYTDLPEVAALVAPRDITFVGRMPEAYAYTKSIFELYGAESKPREAPSLGHAMRLGHTAV